MKLICPACHAVVSAEAWSNDPKAREALRTLAGMPGGGINHKILTYIALFRPKSGRSLRWEKVIGLLDSLKTLMHAPHIQWDKNPARPNTINSWAVAMDRIIENPPKRLPLSSHGYLRRIAWEIADETDRKTEVKRNQSERTGNFRNNVRADSISAQSQPEEILTPEQMRAMLNRKLHVRADSISAHKDPISTPNERTQND